MEECVKKTRLLCVGALSCSVEELLQYYYYFGIKLPDHFYCITEYCVATKVTK